MGASAGGGRTARGPTVTSRGKTTRLETTTIHTRQERRAHQKVTLAMLVAAVNPHAQKAQIRSRLIVIVPWMVRIPWTCLRLQPCDSRAWPEPRWLAMLISPRHIYAACCGVRGGLGGSACAATLRGLCRADCVLRLLASMPEHWHCMQRR